MKKIVYLHIGMHKTGTTALQNFFALNRSVLREKGILYPGNQLAHHKIGGDLRNAANIHDLISRDSHTKKILQEIKRSDAPVILLSSETFVQSKKAPEKIKKAMEMVLGNSIDVKIIFFCRRQDNSLQSAYQQKVKASAIKPAKIPISEFIKDTTYLLKWDYYQKLEDWKAAFGKDAIIVRVYEKNQFYGNDLIKDFLHIFGLELTGDYQLPSDKQSNIGLGPDAVELLRIANQSIDDKDTLQYLFESVQKIDPKRALQPYSLLSPVEKLQLLALFEESNRKVAREYLGRTDGTLFYDPLPNPDDPWKPYEGLTIEKIIPVFVSMMFELHKKCNHSEKPVLK